MRKAMRWFTICLSLLAALLLPASLAAQDREVPYWASMRAPEVNLRVGPRPKPDSPPI